MKSRAPLVMMEQLVMVLVFALAAAVCVRIFALSESLSLENETRDRAVTAVQNAAETLKACRGNYGEASRLLGGTWDGTAWSISYDSGWSPLAEAAEWTFQVLAVPADSGQELLGTAQVTASTWQGNELYSLSVAWQEDAHG